MNLNQPWVKVLKTAKNEKKAKLIMDQLIKKGHGMVATLPPQGNFKVYRIGIFDESQVAIFDKLNQISGMNLENCDSCSKKVNENNFFKCINCGYWECHDCGFQRLYHNQIPIIHNCGEDDFEFVADIGKCVNCGEPMGFRSIPQKLRAQMMGKVRISSMQMMTLGIMGCFTAEKMFIEKEIIFTALNTKQIFDTMKTLHEEPNEWLNQYLKLKANFLKLDWSTSYIVDVVDKFLSMGGKMIFEDTSTRLQNLLPEFRIKAPLHSFVCKIIKNGISKSQYDDFLTQIFTFITKPSGPYFSLKEKKAVAVLRSLSDTIKEPENFNQYATAIEDLILIDDIVGLLDHWHLKCEH